jgi:hypothetical protein
VIREFSRVIRDVNQSCQNDFLIKVSIELNFGDVDLAIIVE